MRRFWIWGMVPLALGILVGILIAGPFIIKWLWAWTVPDLLPGATASGLVAAEISWWSAFKLALFIAFLAAVTGIRNRGRE